MGYRRLQGVPLPDKKQGQIYFTCLNYETERKYTQMKIDRLCDSAGGEYSSALKELLTSGKTVQAVSMKFNLSPETLQKCRRRFYTSWNRRK